MTKVLRKPKWNDENIKKDIQSIITQLGHFPTDSELGTMKRLDLARAIDKNGGTNYFRGMLGVETTRASIGFWTGEKITEELKKIMGELGHFPTHRELGTMKRLDVSNAIRKHGGTNKFRELLGEEIIQVSAGYWTKANTLEKLKKVIAELGHFPKDMEFRVVGRTDLKTAIQKHGGTNKFRELLGEEIIRVSDGYWAEEKITEELKKIMGELGHFPTHRELRTMKRHDVSNAISSYGGFNKFRELLGAEIIHASHGYWTKEKTVEELKKITTKTGKFPTYAEFKLMGRQDLRGAITNNGGFNYFRGLLGEEIIQHSDGYWTENQTLEELKEFMTEIGHFPVQTELVAFGRVDLVGAISKNGGFNKYRVMLGEEILKASIGYWTEDTILKELKKVTAKTIHFPAYAELKVSGRWDLVNAIYRNGGVDKFRKLLGYPPSLEGCVERGAYFNLRGYKSEKEVKKILLKYCNQNGRPEPSYGKKLALGNVIEFVCGAGKIGIDVTNTKDYSEWTIKRKYIEKDYHKYVDKLWIVVLSDIFTTEDYFKFNQESPDNVEVMSVWDLIETLQVDIDEHSRRKIEALETCTFRTKNDLINSLKNRTLAEY